jgi:hypothetical protein
MTTQQQQEDLAPVEQLRLLYKRLDDATYQIGVDLVRFSGLAVEGLPVIPRFQEDYRRHVAQLRQLVEQLEQVYSRAGGTPAATEKRGEM